MITWYNERKDSDEPMIRNYAPFAQHLRALYNKVRNGTIQADDQYWSELESLLSSNKLILDQIYEKGRLAYAGYADDFILRFVRLMTNDQTIDIEAATKLDHPGFVTALITLLGSRFMAELDISITNLTELPSMATLHKAIQRLDSRFNHEVIQKQFGVIPNKKGARFDTVYCPDQFSGHLELDTFFDDNKLFLKGVTFTEEEYNRLLGSLGPKLRKHVGNQFRKKIKRPGEKPYYLVKNRNESKNRSSHSNNNNERRRGGPDNGNNQGQSKPNGYVVYYTLPKGHGDMNETNLLLDPILHPEVKIPQVNLRVVNLY